MLKSLRNTVRITVWIALCALGQYEIVAKSHDLLGDPLPGFWDAKRVEQCTPYQPWTGFQFVDHVIHEGMEAAIFYEQILF